MNELMREKLSTPFHSVVETAKITGLTLYDVRQRLRRGEVPCVMSGKKHMINVPAFLKKLEQESQGAAAAD
ncbi:MAG: hypothetical protein IKH18_04400 [Clostridia bacterium]|nr:hypothetical protein [Clostridia bacterium]